MDVNGSLITLLLWIYESLVMKPLAFIDYILLPTNLNKMFPTSLMTTAMDSITLTATALATLFMLMNVFSKVSLDEKFEIVHLFKPFVIGLIFVSLAKNGHNFIMVFIDIGNSIVSSVKGAVGMSPDSQKAYLEALFKERGFIDGIVQAIFIMVTYAIRMFCYFSIIGTVLGRAISIYTNYIIAPVFISTLGNDKLSNIGISFIRQLFVTILSSIPIFLVVGLASTLPVTISEAIKSNSDSALVSGGADLFVGTISAIVIYFLSKEINELVNRLANSSV